MFDFTTRHSMSLVMAAVLLVITSNGCQSRQHLGAAKPDAQRISQFAPSAQGHATLVAASDDRMLLIWDSRRQQGGKYGIIGRFINADGTAATDEFTINTYVHDHQMHPAAAMAADSRTWVTWSSWMQDGDRGSIVARYFDGATWGHELGVNNTRVGHQTHPVVAISEDGTALVVWTSSTREQSTINARLMRPEGVIGDEFVLSSSDFNGSVPGVAPLADGWLVTWAEHDGEGMHGVHAAQLDAHGEMCNGPILVAADAIEPVVASNGTQAIIACYSKIRIGGGLTPRCGDAMKRPCRWSKLKSASGSLAPQLISTRMDLRQTHPRDLGTNHGRGCIAKSRVAGIRCAS